VSASLDEFVAAGPWPLRVVIRALLPLAKPVTDRTFLDAMLEQHTAARQKLRAYIDHVGKRQPIHPEYVAATVNELATADAVFTVDTGM